ncbi:hypothetical protein [Salinarimonas sp.]|uniref:hypothetical protein n=1 Tax=Salinarimonas sp. TaxID=2766526 RepID=UPI0032D97384
MRITEQTRQLSQSPDVLAMESLPGYRSVSRAFGGDRREIAHGGKSNWQPSGSPSEAGADGNSPDTGSAPGI